jgi:endogenous inhibitor of DNA gyrase (YacG/DUF329 family)
MKEKIFCKACNKETDYVIDSFSKYHLKRHHPEIENLKHYYDLYLKKENEGKCLVCGNDVPTNRFRISKGYQKFCSNKCAMIHVNSNWDVMAEKRRNNNLQKYGVIHPMQLADNNNKRIQTNIEKYGVENPSQNIQCKEKTKETCLERYGVENPFKNEEIKERQKISINNFYNSEDGSIAKLKHSNNMIELYKTDRGKEIRLEANKKINAFYNSEAGEIAKNKISEFRKQLFTTPEGKDILDKIRKTKENNGDWIPLSDKKKFDLYKRNVMNITYRKWKKELFDRWDGLDAYDGQKLITNEEYRKLKNIDKISKMVNMNPLQPTIDHKISIYYGYLNNIPEEEIAYIDNLCICSRRNNTRKSCRVRFPR